MQSFQCPLCGITLEYGVIMDGCRDPECPIAMDYVWDDPEYYVPMEEKERRYD